MFKIGDRVLASLNGTGLPRWGKVSGVLTGSFEPTPQYAVTFDGDNGWTMPCYIHKGA